MTTQDALTAEERAAVTYSRTFYTQSSNVKVLLAIIDRLTTAQSPPADPLAVEEIISRAEQSCRYVLKHNDDSAEKRETDYFKGFTAACEVCEQAIRPHVLRHLATPAAPGDVLEAALEEAAFVCQRKSNSIYPANGLVAREVMYALKKARDEIRALKGKAAIAALPGRTK